MSILKKNWLKFSMGIVLCTLFRLIPFRAPNIEPILATAMPFSKFFGKYSAFVFAFVSMVVYDLLTFRVGVWTFITALAYGLVGVGAFYFLKNKNNSRWNYVKFAVLGTLFFDAVTGLTVGPLAFGQSFVSALTGQIPFTLWHLVGNVAFAYVLSPSIYSFLIKDEKVKKLNIISVFNYKKI
jgi:uncharacterized membrane protein